MKKEYKIILFFILVLFILVSLFFTNFFRFTGKAVSSENIISESFSKNKDKVAILNSTDLNFFSIPKNSKFSNLTIQKKFDVDSNFSITAINYIVSLSLNAQISFNSSNPWSYARIILVDSENLEYLIFEANKIFYLEEELALKNICEETCSLPKINPRYIRIESEGASVYIESLNLQKTKSGTEKYLLNKEVYKKNQEQIKIKKLKETLNKTNSKWIAGETFVSNLSYADKKLLFGLKPGEKLLNTYGFEYYSGGIFDASSSSIEASGSQLTSNVLTSPGSYVTSWDWRNVHGENWMTSAKHQQNCGSCWAFSALGVLESIINLQYNQHLDLDLSEQQVLSCSGAGSCSGGYPTRALQYLVRSPIHEETCFPYSFRDSSCSLCFQPLESWKIAEAIEFKKWDEPIDPNEIKRYLIEKGPLSMSIKSFQGGGSHVMVLVGYSSDYSGDTYILKNSWGDSWGDAGYVYMTLPMEEIKDMAYISNPIPLKGSYVKNCVDKDSDGYCNWGLGSKPLTGCPSSCGNLPDCDDSNPFFGKFDSDYRCSCINCNPSLTCSDSDRGINSLEEGYIFQQGSYTGLRDSCFSEDLGFAFVSQLKEYYCDSNGNPQERIVSCPLGCDTTNSCKDSCSDSDKSFDFFVSGYSSLLSDSIKKEDTCIDSSKLLEYGCDGKRLNSVEYLCPYGCNAGACIHREGIGSQEDPFRIYDCLDLQAKLKLGKNMNQAYYQLERDIDCSETKTWNSGAGFEPIGKNITDKFKAIDFNGNGYAINNLFINRSASNFASATSDVGIVGYLSSGNIYNLKLNNPSVSGYSFVGTLAGHLLSGEITNVKIENGSVEGKYGARFSSFGGLVGYNFAKIQQSSFIGKVFSDRGTTGLLVGTNSGKVIDSNFFNLFGFGANGCIGGGIVSGENVSCRSLNLFKDYWAIDAKTDSNFGGNYDIAFSKGSPNAQWGVWKTGTAWCKQKTENAAYLDAYFEKIIETRSLSIYFAGTAIDSKSLGISGIWVQYENNSWSSNLLSSTVYPDNTNNFANGVFNLNFPNTMKTKRVWISIPANTWGCVDAVKLVGI